MELVERTEDNSQIEVQRGEKSKHRKKNIETDIGKGTKYVSLEFQKKKREERKWGRNNIWRKPSQDGWKVGSSHKFKRHHKSQTGQAEWKYHLEKRKQ